MQDSGTPAHTPRNAMAWIIIAGFSALWLVLGLIASIAPGPVFTSGAAKAMG